MSTSCDGLAWRPEQQQMGLGGVVWIVSESESIASMRERKREDGMMGDGAIWSIIASGGDPLSLSFDLITERYHHAWQHFNDDADTPIQTQLRPVPSHTAWSS